MRKINWRNKGLGLGLSLSLCLSLGHGHSQRLLLCLRGRHALSAPLVHLVLQLLLQPGLFLGPAPVRRLLLSQQLLVLGLVVRLQPLEILVDFLLWARGVFGEGVSESVSE